MSIRKLRRPKPESPRNLPCICGLDVSLTETGVVIAAPNGEIIHACTIISKPGEPEFRRQARITQEIVGEINKSTAMYLGVAVFIEGFAFSSRSGKLLTRAELIGMVKHRLYEENMVIYSVPIKSLKKVVTGNGNANKEDMKNAVRDRFGNYYENDNLADARALVEYGRMVLCENKKLDYELLWNGAALQTFAAVGS